MNRLRFALCLAAFLVWKGPAHAATVAIVWPPTPSAEVTQALTLLRGELLSVGLEVTVSDRAAARRVGETDSLAWLEAFAAQGTSAVVDVVGVDALEAVDVWVLKTRPRRFEVTRVAVEPNTPRQAEMLALRAVEALRAGLLQIDWAERKRRNEVNAKPIARPITNPSAATVPAGEARAVASHGERVALEIGATAMMSVDGLGAAVLPTVRVDWAACPWLVIQAAMAGLGSRSTVATAAGNARVAQQFGVLGGFIRLRPDHRLWPFLGLAAGALHTSVEGQGGLSTGVNPAEKWSGLIDASVGAGLRLTGRTYLTLAAHAQVAAPYVAIHIVDTVGATSGRPNLLLILTIGAWL